jgi:hypothetical protein
MKYYERLKPQAKQLKGLDPKDAIQDCGENNSNPLAKVLLRCETKATKKPKIDETVMFVGLAKKKAKRKKPKKRTYKLANGVLD